MGLSSFGLRITTARGAISTDWNARPIPVEQDKTTSHIFALWPKADHIRQTE